MCIILDANAFSDYLDNAPDMAPVRHWLEGTTNVKPKGKLVYSPEKTITKEVYTHQRFHRKFRALRQQGRVKMISLCLVEKEATSLSNLKSDDPHILALAIAGHVRVLVSKDKNLQQDFKRLTRGKIYQKASHEHLLIRDLCP